MFSNFKVFSLHGEYGEFKTASSSMDCSRIFLLLSIKTERQTNGKKRKKKKNYYEIISRVHNYNGHSEKNEMYVKIHWVER